MFHRLIARDRDFLETFTAIAQRAHAAAQILVELLGSPEGVDERADAIKAIEQEADQQMADLHSGIDRVLVTPIDRDDIHMIAAGLDEIMDLIDGTARRAVTFALSASTHESARSSAVRLAGVLERATAALEVEVVHVRQRARIFELRLRVKELEEEGDQIYFEAVGALFEGRPDVIEVIKWKEIYELLEQSIDACDHAAGSLASVAIKNS
jgi:uncharacterized protein Yka (UPF0111/DUF47 family)